MFWLNIDKCLLNIRLHYPIRPGEHDMFQHVDNINNKHLCNISEPNIDLTLMIEPTWTCISMLELFYVYKKFVDNIEWMLVK